MTSAQLRSTLMPGAASRARVGADRTELESDGAAAKQPGAPRRPRPGRPGTRRSTCGGGPPTCGSVGVLAGSAERSGWTGPAAAGSCFDVRAGSEQVVHHVVEHDRDDHFVRSGPGLSSPTIQPRTAPPTSAAEHAGDDVDADRKVTAKPIQAATQRAADRTGLAAPMLNRPARKAIATDRPVRISGVASNSGQRDRVEDGRDRAAVEGRSDRRRAEDRALEHAPSRRPRSNARSARTRCPGRRRSSPQACRTCCR